MDQFFTDIGTGAAYGGVALALLVTAFFAIGLTVPGRLASELIERRNVNVAAVLGAGTLAMSFIIASAIHASGGSLSDGLTDTVAYGLTGIVLQVVGVWVLDLLTPGRLGDILHGEVTMHPATWAQVAWQLGLGLVLAAAIS